MDVSTVKQASVQPSAPPKPAEKVRQAGGQEEPKRQENEAKQASAPKPTPVINTQGQTTGRLLNTTA